MTPKQVKDAAHECSCRVCRTIIEQDLFVGAPAVDGTAQVITTQYDGKRCQECGKPIPLGTRVMWIRGKGAYHYPHCTAEGAEHETRY